MNDEVIESAKAIQEVAKASKEAIGATQKLGTYIAGLVKEPMDSIIGILSDRLKFVRWQRQVRLEDKIKEIISERNLQDTLEPVPLKFALPILENATIEENDDLQDLWAALLVAAGDPCKNKSIKIAFVSMLKELDPLDAKILDACYNYASSKFLKDNDGENIVCFGKPYYNGKNWLKKYHIPIDSESIYKTVGIKKLQGLSAFDNLVRLRLLAEFVKEESIEVPDADMDFTNYDVAIVDKGYFNLTALGVEFVNACMRD